jgi:transposase
MHVDGNNWRLELKGIDGPIHCRGKLPAKPNAMTDADIRLVSGTWWLSVATDMDDRIRSEIEGTTHVRLDGLDCFAEVDGRKLYAFDIGVSDDARIGQIQQRMSELDQRSDEYAQLRREKARRQARQARRRREKLHEWTTSLVRGASRIELVIPSAVKEQTKSGRGDRKEWGAAVEAKAALNRQVLSLAPAMAIQMIRYKAKEAGVELVETKSDHLEVGNHLVAATKAVRKLKSIITEARNNE